MRSFEKFGYQKEKGLRLFVQIDPTNLLLGSLRKKSILFFIF